MIKDIQIHRQVLWPYQIVCELSNILSSIPLLVKFAKVNSVDCKRALCPIYHPNQNTPSSLIAKWNKTKPDPGTISLIVVQLPPRPTTFIDINKKILNVNSAIYLQSCSN